ncbi:threonine-phosphate decarboxylase [Belnapia sp. T18]|uniref:threonine-phosphate decarboxylase n=1 Tax=Belnapia arida TaxID=2804533 RepID=A0ABS1U155_9PROT|nr:threonine-phosphate decarboxylase CobD [Belnapia arida]MBL6078255.1 threonine-phosphate decarboxylase [Belnapia arida]
MDGIPGMAHGGDLEAARRLFPQAPTPFLDLSTGINPHGYPMPPLGAEVFARLPEPAALARLEALAAERYGAPSAAHVVAAPGTQLLLPLVAGLMPPGGARILGPTYAEHRRAAELAGHAVGEVGAVEGLEGAGLAVLVNPNNPDGRLAERRVLLGLRAGLLVVDEAFMEVMPSGASLGGEVGRGGVVVLRSFGKFHGLAGVRLGFALAEPRIAERLRASLGPWAVSGPAIAAGMAALGDLAWAEAMRARLAAEAARLDALLGRHGLAVVGGTALFRLVRGAEGAFEGLGRQGVLVRRFEGRPGLLRFGLPGDEAGWERLGRALDGCGAARGG